MGGGKRAGVIVAVLTIAAAVLRVIGLDRGLWYDEIVTLVEFARAPLGQIVAGFPNNNNHPLYSLLAHLGIRAFGEHPWSLRLPAVVFGIASVPLLYRLAAQVTARREAVWAAVVLTASYHHVWFSQNARGYSALAFWVMLSTLCLLNGLRSGRTSWYIAYAVAAALGMYTHLTTAVVVGAQAIVCAWIGIRPREPDRWHGGPRLWIFGFALAGVLAMLMYAPAVIKLYHFYARPQSTAQVATVHWLFWETLRGVRVGLGTAGAVAAGLLAAIGLCRYWRQDPAVTALFVLPGLLTGLAGVALGWPLRPRFFFFLIGFGVLFIVRGSMVAGAWIVRGIRKDPGRKDPAYVVDGGGADGPGPWRELIAGDALMALVVVASAVSLGYAYRYPKQDFDGARAFVDATRAASEPVVTVGPAAYPYHYYYREPWQEIHTPEQLRAVRSGGQSVWIVYTLADYIDIDTPGIMPVVRRECPPVKVFPGTVAGGDITVCRAAPLARRLEPK